jgi:hypothetical protein
VMFAMVREKAPLRYGGARRKPQPGGGVQVVERVGKEQQARGKGKGSAKYLARQAPASNETHENTTPHTFHLLLFPFFFIIEAWIMQYRSAVAMSPLADAAHAENGYFFLPLLAIDTLTPVIGRMSYRKKKKKTKVSRPSTTQSPPSSPHWLPLAPPSGPLP